LDIEAFAWDEANEAKIAERFDPAEIDEVLESTHTIIRNKRNRAGSHRVIGRSYGGTMITIVVAPTGQSGIWRPVTAWRSDREELAHAEKAGI